VTLADGLLEVSSAPGGFGGGGGEASNAHAKAPGFGGTRPDAVAVAAEGAVYSRGSHGGGASGSVLDCVRRPPGLEPTPAAAAVQPAARPATCGLALSGSAVALQPPPAATTAAAAAAAPTSAPRSTCAAGHPLVPNAPPRPGGCDGCAQDSGRLVVLSCRACNYELCEACATALPPAAKLASPGGDFASANAPTPVSSGFAPGAAARPTQPPLARAGRKILRVRRAK
jgi:hypothetical protein